MKSKMTVRHEQELRAADARGEAVRIEYDRAEAALCAGATAVASRAFSAAIKAHGATAVAYGQLYLKHAKERAVERAMRGVAA
jgi:hypothetical protein